MGGAQRSEVLRSRPGCGVRCHADTQQIPNMRNVTRRNTFTLCASLAIAPATDMLLRCAYANASEHNYAYHDDTDKYSIYIPQGWETVPGPAKGAVAGGRNLVTFVAPDGSDTNVSVLV
eukprot:CAMPEP_0114292266 /NCGR_PEP_ID=MMETSP0059-20121206/8966_1 /TAXON_ID=36894 /ORGANISM="Pyramimonas parkeae, Strain CCMP726" /LENGTH=118 /DNA_ID=CAMNT_0001413895 /DNA_START=89 /DNA_END=441 /DNA_ORIENTATION=+